jgi:hypothetical protein
MTRFHQALLIGSFVPLCWLGIMIVHELGHVLVILATDGVVEKVVLHPLTISRTDAGANPRPLAVVWAGPVCGVLLPLLACGFAGLVGFRWTYLLRSFAGFCLIANGCYIGAGSFGGIGDAGDMLRHGSSIWMLWLFGGATVPLGLFLWNGQGVHFGFGAANGRVDHRAACVCLGLLVAIVVLEMMFSSTC